MRGEEALSAATRAGPLVQEPAPRAPAAMSTLLRWPGRQVPHAAPAAGGGQVRLGDLVRGARLHEGNVAASRKALLLERIADRADSISRNRTEGIRIGLALWRRRLRPGSLDCAQAASALAGSMVPSGSSGMRPPLAARSTATWLTPRCRAHRVAG
jgi:hypothetical protein